MIGSDLAVVVVAPRGASGPPLALDFVVGRYGRAGETSATLTGLGGVSFARSGAGTALRADGSLAGFVSGAPRITDRGLFLEGAATNKCTAFNANPDGALTGLTRSGAASATLTRVSSPSMLAAAGLGSIATSGYLLRLDNSAGATSAMVTVAGPTGVATAHSFSAWVGGGTGWIGRSSSINQSFAASGVLRRVVGANLAVNTGSMLNILADAGQAVDFILPQLEVGAASSPIVTAGGVTARGADSASVVVPGGCAGWTATYGEGLTASGAVNPGDSFDLIAGRPWVGGFLKTLMMT